MPEGPDDIAAFLSAPSQPSVRPDVGGLLNFYADKYGVDRSLVQRVAKQESGFKMAARSSKGAIGVMQLMPQTAAGLGVDPRDPEQNIEGGVRYLKQQLDEFGNERLALAAYNAGPGRVRKAKGVPKIAETQQYVNAIAGPDDVAAFLQKAPEPTAAHESIMRDTGVDYTAADKALRSGSLKNVGHLPPAVPSRAAPPVDQVAAQYEAIKAGGQLGKLSPEDYATFTAPLKAAGWEVGADYIKPPAAAPGAYPLWERQLALGAAGNAPKHGSAWYERTAAGRAVRSVFELAGGMIESVGKVAGETIMGRPGGAMKELDRSIVQPQLDQMNQAYDLYKQRGKVDPEIAAHALAYAIPFLGPVAASFGEKTGKGVGKISAGDTAGWEDLIAAVPEGVMLVAPLLPKAFKAMERGVPAEQAMASVAEQLRPLIDAKLKEPIAVEGAAATGAKPKVVLPREGGATNARQGTPIQREAGPAGEAYRPVGTEGGNVAQEGDVSGLRNRQQAEGQPKGEVADVNQEPIPSNAGREPAVGIETSGAGQVAASGKTGEAAAKTEAQQVGERSLPKTLERGGLVPGTDLTYDIAHDQPAIEAANRNIAEKGVQGAREFALSGDTPTKEQATTGYAVIRALQDAGDFEGANAVASELSARQTASGQFNQAASTVMSFAPEQALVTAQKIVDRAGTGKLKPAQAERVTNAAKVIETESKVVAKTEANLDNVLAKLPAASPANWRAKLLGAEEAARARLTERQAAMKAGTLKEFGSGGLSTEELADYATIGAAKLARKGIDFATWAKEMSGEFGDSIKPHLTAIYRKSFEAYSGAKREAYQAMKERAVTKGLPPMTAQELATAVAQRDLAIKRRTAATRGLAREYESLQPGARFKREVLSVLNLPRALKASLDLSAPLRQGAVFLPEVKASGKAFGAQIRALTERGFEKVYADIQANPEFQSGQAAGLELTGSPLRSATKLNAAEEAFMTRWAEKIPGVKQSEQAYSAYLDTLRMNVFEKYAKQIKGEITDPKLQAAELKHWASFVNKATGRGDLGRAGNAMAPILNSAFFAPRYAVSRLQILNPATYMKMTPFARKIALRKMFQFSGMVGTTLALAKAGGLEVSTDPQSADFLKIKSGDTRFDILAGTQQWMRFGARLSAGFYKSSQGEKLKETDKPLAVIERFARSKASPPASVVWDYATGRTFEGQQPTLKGELQDQFIPLFAKDSYDTWKSVNTPTATKAVATAAGFFGVGVQTYSPRAKKPAPKRHVDQQKELRKLLGLE